MSVINKMLQDLDRRHALGAAGDAQIVRPARGETGKQLWFWLLLVVLLAAALGWMGWVAVQIASEKPLVTPAALKAAAEAQTRPTPKPASAAPSAAPPAAPPAPVEPPKAAEEPKSVEALRLAVQLAAPGEPPEAEAKKPDTVKPAAPKPRALPAAPAVAAKPAVDKRERARSANDVAETHFRRAVLLLNHGRVSEAEDQLIAALNADPSHHDARQAYVALLLEQQRSDAARRVLQQTLAINPAQPTFALALARLHAEQRDFYAALEVMERAGSVARNADFQALRGAVLQRLSRHAEAVEAYQNAVRGGAQAATNWVGLGISFEALGRKTEAAESYRRALAAGPIAAEAREYAESRARALQ